MFWRFSPRSCCPGHNSYRYLNNICLDSVWIFQSFFRFCGHLIQWHPRGLSITQTSPSTGWSSLRAGPGSGWRRQPASPSLPGKILLRYWLPYRLLRGHAVLPRELGPQLHSASLILVVFLHGRDFNNKFFKIKRFLVSLNSGKYKIWRVCLGGLEIK